MTKILVVEDNERHRVVLTRRLRTRGFDVVTAEDGAQAVDATRRDAPDLVVMDVRLPVMNGIDATRAIKSDESIRHVPVIAVSAGGVGIDASHCIEAGCVDFQSKPFSLDDLVEKIRRHTP